MSVPGNLCLQGGEEVNPTAATPRRSSVEQDLRQQRGRPPGHQDASAEPQVARQNASRLLRPSRTQVAEVVREVVEVAPTAEDLQRLIDICA
jgi:hypothetical protein